MLARNPTYFQVECHGKEIAPVELLDIETDEAVELLDIGIAEAVELLDIRTAETVSCLRIVGNPAG